MKEYLFTKKNIIILPILSLFNLLVTLLFLRPVFASCYNCPFTVTIFITSTIFFSLLIISAPVSIIMVAITFILFTTGIIEQFPPIAFLLFLIQFIFMTIYQTVLYNFIKEKYYEQYRSTILLILITIICIAAFIVVSIN
jgi:hypothetical protein